MLRAQVFPSAVVAVLLSAVPTAMQAANEPMLSGTYRCEGPQQVCEWSGTTFTVQQTGANFEIRNERGETGRGTIGGPYLSLGPTWNMLGVVLADNRIQWSNGTHWRRQ